jgi:hypothetical protein
MRIEDATIIPYWLKEHLIGPCPYCGSNYEVGYSPNNMRVTKHYCPNRHCPGTVAMKMVFMWNVLKVDGIKFGKSMELIKKHKIDRHMDALPYVIEGKPQMDLATFMRLNCIQGIDDAWSNVCAGKESIEDVIKTPTAQKMMSPSDVEDALRATQYVEFIYAAKQKYDPVVRMTVMMTGDVMELSNRELLIPALNKKYKGLLDLRYSKSNRKTGISVLIKEKESAITGKVGNAEDANIPIMTSMEFVLYIDRLIKERAGDKYDDV